MDNINEIIFEIFNEKWDENFIINSNSDKKIKYSEFFSQLKSYQKYFNKIGIKRNDLVCTILNNSEYFLKMYFVALICNFTIVPIDPEKSKNEINEIINLVKPKIVIIDKDIECSYDYQININNIKLELINISKDDLSDLFNVDINRDYLITFTSGTTGCPKGVVHSFKNLILSSLAFNEKFNFNEKNVFLHNLPMSYMAGILNTIFLPFITKGKIVIGKRFSIENLVNFWDIPQKYVVNTFWFTPTIIGLLLKFDRSKKGINYTLDKKIIGCVGTSALNYSIKKEFEKKYNINLYQSYGLSEVLFVSTNYSKSDDDNVGEILNGVNLKIINEEILIDVPWMLKKYFNSKNQNKINNKYFKSGDLGKVYGKKLTISGRKKELIIKGGLNINPKKIEDFVIKEKFFDECVIMGFPDIVLGEKIVCFILANFQNKLKKKELNKKIIEELGRNYHIDEFVELKEIAKNINGKTNKLKIKEFYLKYNDCTT